MYSIKSGMRGVNLWVEAPCDLVRWGGPAHTQGHTRKKKKKCSHHGWYVLGSEFCSWSVWVAAPALDRRRLLLLAASTPPPAANPPRGGAGRPWLAGACVCVQFGSGGRVSDERRAPNEKSEGALVCFLKAPLFGTRLQIEPAVP